MLDFAQDGAILGTRLARAQLLRSGLQVTT